MTVGVAVAVIDVAALGALRIIYFIATQLTTVGFRKRQNHSNRQLGTIARRKNAYKRKLFVASDRHRFWNARATYIGP